MFTSLLSLKKKSGKKGIDRPDYLEELISEYNSSKSRDQREQVLANLSNFAYDPLNHKWLLEFGVLDIFLKELEESSSSSSDLTQFAATGLSNISANDQAKKLIVQKGGIPIIGSLLNSPNEKIVLDSLTTLIFLSDVCCKSDVLNSLNRFTLQSLASSENRRLSNLSTILKERLSDVSSNV